MMSDFILAFHRKKFPMYMSYICSRIEVLEQYFSTSKSSLIVMQAEQVIGSYRKNIQPQHTQN